MRISGVNFLVKRGISNIKHNRVMSLASFCVLTVSMLLIGFTFLFLLNLNMMIGDVEAQNEVIVFLKDNLTETQTEIIGQKISSVPNVASVTFYSKEQGFAEIRGRIPNSDELFDYIGDDSPLPDSYRVKIHDLSEISPSLMAINRIEGVYQVQAPTDFIGILTSLRGAFTIIAAAVLAALLIVCIIVVSNTARASVDMRKREITIMKLVGATNEFIRIPFFIEGLTMGLVSGAFSAAITYISYNAVDNLLSNSDTTLFTALGIGGLIPPGTIALPYIAATIGSGALISAIVTGLSTHKYLKV
ncbi:MAG: ABC transporter permease [Ruminococcus sp.]|nr:ABC transporter permease [Ruminococcus sp.]